ncbi:MAG: GNAT family N-acetyltransferase [Saprospiraceae bacterium]
MIVRRATAHDFPQYLALAKEFHAASPVRHIIDLDADGYAAFYAETLTNDNIGVWLAEKDSAVIGIAGALAYPMYFSPTNLVVQELWWWLTPAARGSGAGKAMFDAISTWAEQKKAKALFMIALEDDNAKRMENVYRRAGFKPMERTFIKEVTAWQ